MNVSTSIGGPGHEHDEPRVLEELKTIMMSGGHADDKLATALELIRWRLAVLEPQRTGLDRGSSAHPFQRRAQSREHAGGELSMGLGVRLVGTSVAMKQVEQAIQRVSQSQATVLIRGESGTGKELVARAVHQQSVRRRGKFVPLHCAAVTEALLESELFGHERGAFTGAHEQRKGKFELAHGGTLFLDEIGDIPCATQVKLLRVLQEKCVERVGGSRPIPIDVRVISATHRDLEGMVHAGAFREDLYYRLNVVPITLPPLRQRSGDIPLLIDHFLMHFTRQNRRRLRLGADLLALMTRYHWPGNIRELQNCLERLVVMADPHHDVVALETIPASLRGYFSDMKHVTGPAMGTAGRETKGPDPQPLGASLQEIERARLREVLNRTGWVQAKTARVLGLTPRQVAYKMRKYGMRDETKEVKP